MTDFIDAQTGEVLPNTEDNVIVAFAIYQQEAARQEHWTRHRYLNDPQKKGIKARLSEAGGMSAWREAIGIASRSEFLTGQIPGKSGRFKLDLNFLIRPTTFAKILDGFYTRDDGPTTKKLTLPTMQPPHMKPQPAFVPEPIEVREQAMIDSYRRHGRHADANRIEEQRAKRLGVPAVLVPAPEVAFTSTPDKPAPAARKPAVFDDIPWTDEDIPVSAYHEAEA